MAEHHLKHDGWLVIADGEKALFLRNEGDEKYPNLNVFREFEHENPPDREQGTDAPGRFNDASGTHRSSVQETDWHQLEKDRFAKELSDRLYKHAHKGKFSELILVAPPKVLGEMRKDLHKEVADKVIAEVDKDLTNHPVDQIEKVVFGTA